MSGVGQISDRKRRMRLRCERARRSIRPNARRAASAAIAREIMAQPVYAAARIVAAYLALPSEVQTGIVIRDALRRGKRVCVPLFDKRRGTYIWVWLHPGARLRPGRQGVMEPARHLLIGRARIDLAIVPGVAFDRHGRRLGRGAGWYDRLLSQPALRNGIAIGVAFEAQIVRQVPVAGHDRPVDMIATERGSWRAGRLICHDCNCPGS